MNKEKTIKFICFLLFTPVYLWFIFGLFLYGILLPIPQVLVDKFLEKRGKKYSFQRFFKSYVSNISGLFKSIFRV